MNSEAIIPVVGCKSPLGAFAGGERSPVHERYGITPLQAKKGPEILRNYRAAAHTCEFLRGPTGDILAHRLKETGYHGASPVTRDSAALRKSPVLVGAPCLAGVVE